MNAFLVNYNYTPNWLREYDIDYILTDRSDGEYLKDFPKGKVVKTPNVGNVDNDKLSFLIANYERLPDVFIWGKTNLFKYISKEEFDKVKDNKAFTPLLTQNHKVYSDAKGKVCYYKKGMYYERNDSWYLNVHPAKVKNWKEWAQMFDLPNPKYIPFAPGGNYILTKEVVHKYPVDFYRKMRQTLLYTQLPGEAQLCERSYYLLWS